MKSRGSCSRRMPPLSKGSANKLMKLHSYRGILTDISYNVFKFGVVNYFRRWGVASTSTSGSQHQTRQTEIKTWGAPTVIRPLLRANRTYGCQRRRADTKVHTCSPINTSSTYLSAF